MSDDKNENKTELLAGLPLIKALSLAFGPSGCEGEVAELIKAQIGSSADEVTTDRFGNVTAVLRGTGENKLKLMAAAHMDEVGFMISSIDGDGFLHFSNLGGITGHVLPAKRVTVRGTRFDKEKDAFIPEKIKGYITEKPIHMQSGGEYANAPSAGDLGIDIGAANKDDASKKVREGDFATFDSEFVEFGSAAEGYEHVKIKSKALDDRLGCAVLIETLRTLSENRPEGVDIYFAFTVREEVGVSGAGAAAFRIAPDFAIVLEATAVADIDKTDANARVAEQGKGGAISLLDRTTIYNKALVDFTMKLAADEGIPAQLKKYVSGGNDAGGIHQSRAGVKTIALSMPTRYIHTPANVADLRDYAAVKALVAAFLVNVKNFKD